MVIDRIIAGTIFVLGMVQIALMYAAQDMAPLSMTSTHTRAGSHHGCGLYHRNDNNIFSSHATGFHAVDMPHC